MRLSYQNSVKKAIVLRCKSYQNSVKGFIGTIFDDSYQNSVKKVIAWDATVLSEFC